MKKSIKRFLSACAVMTALTAVSALSVSAAGDVTAKEDTGKTAIEITLSDAAKKELKGQVTVLVFKGDSTVAVPTEDQIVYLDQKAQADGDFVFAKVLPYLGETTTPMADGDTYTVRISKTGGVTEKGFYETTFKVGEEDATLYGDVDLNGRVTAGDATLILRLKADDPEVSFNAQQEKNADVDLNGRITAGDATYILRYKADDPAVKELPIKK